MALPTTGPINMTMVANELGISPTGLSLNDPRVRALAGKLTGPISLGDLRGKSAVMTLTAGAAADGTYMQWAGFFTSVYLFGSDGTQVGSISSDALPGGVTLLGLGFTREHGGDVYHNRHVVLVDPGNDSFLVGKTVYVNGVGYPISNVNNYSSYASGMFNGSAASIFESGQSYSIRIE